MTSTQGRGPAALKLPGMASEEGENVPGLKFVAVSVPVIVALPVTDRFPPRLRPNAEILFPATVDERSGRKNYIRIRDCAGDVGAGDLNYVASCWRIEVVVANAVALEGIRGGHG